MTATDCSDADTFKDTTALITGAARGVGRACAVYLASRGATLVLHDAHAHPADIRTTADACTRLGSEVVVVEGASADEHHAARLVETSLVASSGQLDVLVMADHAGGRGQSLPSTSAEDIRSVIGVELLWTIWLARAALPHLLQAPAARIVTVTSSIGAFGFRDSAITAASRAGVMGFTRALALDLEGTGAAVNAIAPIATHGPTESLFRGEIHVDPQRYDPQAVAPTMAYLCHSSCALNGQVISVGGGRAARILSSVSVGHVDPAATVARTAMNLPRILAADHALQPHDALDELLLIEI